MKKFVSALLATLFVLTAFGVTSIFAGFVGANAEFYDYYKYTQIPGFANFTDAELGLLWNKHVKDGHTDTTLGVDNAVTWTVCGYNQWKALDIYSGAPCNMLAQNHNNKTAQTTRLTEIWRIPAGLRLRDSRRLTVRQCPPQTERQFWETRLLQAMTE